LPRPYSLPLSAAAAVLSATVSHAQAPAPQPRAVVELFTSQGCSSCPPADKLMGDFARDPSLVAMSLPIDYWDYLGWKDTLGSPEFSQRQYDYAKARGDMDVYTPQMIVNGDKQMVGSQRSEVMAVLAQSHRKGWDVPLSLTDGGKELVVEAGAGPVGEATLWVLPVLDRISVKIGKGEIAGQEVTYHNVVRKLLPAGMWNGAPTRLSLPKDSIMPEGSTACIALLQQGKAGRVMGVASWGTLVS
jgi:hypothetical protein